MPNWQTEHEEKEASDKFLDRRRETFHRFTEIDPWDWTWRQKSDLKIFLTQSAPDIHHKLLKQAYGPDWKRPWCWERLKVRGEGDDREWGGWMASSTQRTRVWVGFGSWWCTGKPSVLQSMGSQSQRRLSNRTELNWLAKSVLRYSVATGSDSLSW